MAFGVFDGHGVGFGLADDEDFFFAAGDAGVEEVTLEHHEVLLHDGEDDDGVFTALAFVDGDGVGEGHVVGVGLFKLLGFAVKFGLELAGFRVGGGDETEVSVEKVFVVVVAELDDFVTGVESGGCAGTGVPGLGIEGGLEELVKVVYAGDAFVHGGEDLGLGGGAVTAVGELVGAEVDDEIDAVLGVLGVEIMDVLAGRVDARIGEGDTALEDAMGGGGDGTVFALAEDSLEAGDGGAAGFDKVFEEVTGADGGKLVCIADE